MSPDPNLQIAPQQHSESKPVLYLTLIASSATIIVGVLASIPGVPTWVPIVVAGVGALATAWVGVLTKTQVTPWEDVGAKLTPEGVMIAGPAASQRTGTPAEVVPSVGQTPVEPIEVQPDSQ